MAEGLRLYKWWHGPERPRALVWYVLGLEGGTMPPYPRLSNALADAGFASALVHPRGTGRSPGRRGDIDDLGHLLSDHRRFHDEIQRRAPGVPIFVFGHSAGAAFAAEIAATATTGIAGVILVNPAYRLRATKGMTPSWREYAAFAVNLLLRPTSPVVDMNGRPLEIAFAPDREEGLALQRDPLVVRYFSMRLLLGQRRLMNRLPENVGALQVPVLIVQGAHDALVDPRGNDILLGRTRATGSTKLIVAEGGHGSSAVEMAVEPIVRWIETRLANVSPYAQTSRPSSIVCSRLC